MTNPSLCTLFKTSPRNLGQHHQAHRQKRKTQYTLQRDINLSFCSLMWHQRSFIPGERHLFSVPPKGLGYSCGSQLLDTSACGLMKAWRRVCVWSVLRPLLVLVALSESVPLLWKRPILKCSFLNPDFFSSHCLLAFCFYPLFTHTDTRFPLLMSHKPASHPPYFQALPSSFYSGDVRVHHCCLMWHDDVTTKIKMPSAPSAVEAGLSFCIMWH